MKKLLSICLIAITLAATAQPRTISGVFDYGKARHIMNNINNIRQAKGLKPLRMETSLTEAAMLRAAESAFRYEEELNGTHPDMIWQRPNGSKDLQLIAEQYHDPSTFTQYYYIHHSQDHYTKISKVVKDLRNKGDYTSAISSSTMQAMGCGAFLSPKGYYYWVLYFIPGGDKKSDIPAGQWKVQVQVAQKKEEHTSTVSRTKSETDQTPTSFEVTGCFNYKKAIEVVECTNKERAAKGLKPYIMDSLLMELAMIRAAEMKSIKEMTHTRPNGDSGPDIVSHQDFGVCPITRENIGHGQSTASEVVSQWMNSPGHRAGILDKDCNRMGAGECNGYWVQLFVKTKMKLRALSKSAARIDEVTVMVTIDPNGESRVVKRKRVE